MLNRFNRFLLCILCPFSSSIWALKMVPAEDVCVQQGLEPGSPEYAQCLEREQSRQAALMQMLGTAGSTTSDEVTDNQTDTNQPPQEEPLPLPEAQEMQASSAVTASPSDTDAASASSQVHGSTVQPHLVARMQSSKAPLSEQEFNKLENCMDSTHVNEHGQAEEKLPQECSLSQGDTDRL